MSSTQYPPHTDLKFIQCNTNSFLPTDRHSGFLINTHRHARTSSEHAGIQAHSCVPSCATACWGHTETPSLYLCKHTHSLLCMWNWHTLWKWLSPSADLSGSIAQRAGFSAQQGQDLWGIIYVVRWGGVSLWPLASFKLSSLTTIFSDCFWLWGFWTQKNYDLRNWSICNTHRLCNMPTMAFTFC